MSNVTSTPQWFHQGYDGVSKEEQRMAAMYGPGRFWIKEETSKQIVFIDDDPFSIYEHNPTLDGDWKNWLTCMAGTSDQIVCCESLGKAAQKYFVGFLTICDVTEMTGENSKYMYELKFLPAKVNTLKKFKMKKEKRKTLIGDLYDVTRMTKKEPTVGGEFEYSKATKMDVLFDHATYKGKKISELFTKADTSPEEMEKLKRVFQLQFDSAGKLLHKLVPFNYRELLQPKSPADMKAFLAGKAVTGFGGTVGGPGVGGHSPNADESIPF